MKKFTLLVEDDPGCASVTAAYCELAGASTTIVGTLREAIEALVTGRFDLVVLDLGLPDSTPLATLDRIPELIRLGARAIVVITGLERTKDLRAMVKKTGAIDVLEKGSPELGQQLREIILIG